MISMAIIEEHRKDVLALIPLVREELKKCGKYQRLSVAYQVYYSLIKEYGYLEILKNG